MKTKLDNKNKRPYNMKISKVMFKPVRINKVDG